MSHGRIIVVEPGLCTSVQDLGRPGYGSMGVSESGAADRLSLRIGNRLVGNPDGAAAIESTLLGATLRFEGGPAMVAVTGGDAEPTIAGADGVHRPIPMWQRIPIRQGDTLRTGALRRGVRTMICIAGGINTAMQFGSRSVHAPSGLGGNALRAGDTVEIGQSSAPMGGTLARNPEPGRASTTRMALMKVVRSLSRGTLRIVLDGSAASRGDEQMLGGAFEVLRDSDRMGVRLASVDRPGGLTHPPIGRDGVLHESVPTIPGMIQSTPDGHLIALGPDAATTGGYPVLATVIAPDLDALAQRRPGAVIRFETVDLDTAWRAWHERERAIDAILPACTGGTPSGGA